MYTQESGSSMVIPCVINGEAVSLPDTQNFPVIEGKTGETVHCAQSATVDVAIMAVEAAARAFKSWKRVPMTERRDILNRAADILQSKTSEATKRTTIETSCDHHWAASDCSVAATMIRQNAATGMTIGGKIPAPDDPDNLSLVFKEPVGVVMIIPP
jgi:acyl-CoA reductase-like NAD-dependent aldehyde dehydrogenase